MINCSEEADADGSLILRLPSKHWVLPLKRVAFIVCELHLHKAEREINTSNRNGKNPVAGDQDRKKCNPFSIGTTGFPTETPPMPGKKRV